MINPIMMAFARSLRGGLRREPKPNEALPQTVEHVGIYADLSVWTRPR
jgi:hypothetical protein